MNPYLLLAMAIGAEVTGTIALRFSEGFTRLGPSALVVLGYGVAFYLLALVLKAGVPVGVAYAVWAAVGVALIALIGAVFLDESLTLTTVAGLALVIGGVVLIELGRTAA
ncbi:MAG: DMT family transporter [Thermocrispum sp.]